MVGGLGFHRVIVLGVFAILLAAGFLFLLTWSRAIRHIRPRNRVHRLSPEKVWLCLIPLAGAVIAVGLVLAMADSIRRQLQELDEDDYSGAYGLPQGLIWSIAFVPSSLAGVAALVFNVALGDIPGVWLSILCCMGWIMYWRQISHYHRLLKKLVPAQYSADEMDYSDDTQDDWQ